MSSRSVRRAFGQVDDLDHFDQAVQVLGDLLDDLVRSRW